MATEIEHKYLTANDSWRKQIERSSQFRQGYLTSAPTSSVRIRIGDGKAWINIKSATIGNSRSEYEYEIPLSDACEILSNLCQKPLIEKIRHYITVDHHIWEVDEFEGENKGLIVAEIELKEVNEKFTKPSWIGLEVTEDLRYYNNNLAKNPYSKW